MALPWKFYVETCKVFCVVVFVSISVHLQLLGEFFSGFLNF